MYSAKILADSISPNEIRLVTYELTFPRFILAELNTHRVFSRNSASSRAMPTEKVIAQVETNPFVPDFNRRVKGMGVGEPLYPGEQAYASHVWIKARDAAIEAARSLDGVDKSRVNRLLEPFMWHTALVTATDWSNFFTLRTDAGAQPEFRKLALMMRDLYESNEPWACSADCWHLPLITEKELGSVKLDYAYWKQVSTGRCARVSFLTHDGERDTAYDVGLHNRLRSSGHFSPFEHLARPFTFTEWEMIWAAQDELRGLYTNDDPDTVERMCRQLEYCGNLRGWKQYRSEIPNQHDFSLVNQ